MASKLLTTPAFERQARKFIVAHPDLKARLAAVLRQLETDPTHPALRLHPLGGKLKGIHAVRINFSYRITLVLRLTRKEIQLLDLGSHARFTADHWGQHLKSIISFEHPTRRHRLHASPRNA